MLTNPSSGKMERAGTLGRPLTFPNNFQILTWVTRRILRYVAPLSVSRGVCPIQEMFDSSSSTRPWESRGISNKKTETMRLSPHIPLLFRDRLAVVLKSKYSTESAFARFDTFPHATFRISACRKYQPTCRPLGLVRRLLLSLVN